MAENRIKEFCGDRGSAANKFSPQWGRTERSVTVRSHVIAPDWMTKLKAAVDHLTEKIGTSRIEQLEMEVSALKDICKQLKYGQSLCVPIQTLTPEPFIVRKPFHVVVRPSDGEFIATFFDANIGMSGDTAEEAVQNLKMTLVDTFEQFEELEDVLGPLPRKQLAVLREYIKKQA